MNPMMENTTDTNTLNRTARRNAMRAAKKASQASRGKAPVLREEGEQHVWHVTMTLGGDLDPVDGIVIATTAEFAQRAMLGRYARDNTPDELAAGFVIEQLDDGRFSGPFRVETQMDEDEGGLQIDGPYASLLEAANRADAIFDIVDYDAGSRIFDSNGSEVLHLTLETRDTGVVRYRPGYYN